jgi:hypothetical protein
MSSTVSTPNTFASLGVPLAFFFDSSITSLNRRKRIAIEHRIRDILLTSVESKHLSTRP